MKYEENMKMERETGHSEGYAEGLKAGEATGVSKVALNMLKESMPVDLISRITGLPESEIEELAEKM